MSKIVGFLVLGLAAWLIANILHTIHISIHTAHLAATIAGFTGVSALLATLIGVTAVKFWCPEVSQPIERADDAQGYGARFVAAGELKVGDYLRDPEDERWNRVNELRIASAVIWQFVTERETIKVNDGHRVKDENDKWVYVRDLFPGQRLRGYPSGTVTVRSVDCLGKGDFASITCERQRYVLGHSIGHNDSADMGAFILHNVNAAIASAGGFSRFNAAGNALLGGFALVGGVTGSTRSYTSKSSQDSTTITFTGPIHIAGYAGVEQLGKDLAQAQRNAKRNRSYMSDRTPVTS